MRHYIIFNDKNSLDMGLRMAEALAKSSPMQRCESIIIPGRNGTLTTSDGTYEPFIAQAEFTVPNIDNIDEICAAFKGSSWLTSDKEPDKRYSARVKNQIDFARFIRQYHKFAVQFECQPFARELNPQPAVFTSAGSLYNIGTFEAQPAIKVYGSGNITVTINGKTFTVQNVSGSAVIDCENMLAYSGTNLLVTSGEFPVLPIGKNTISFTGATKIEITPNWRWL